MTPVHPQFDPATGTWFLDTGEEAATVRELLKKLPRGSRVADYFPGGREVTSQERGFCIEDMRRRELDVELRPRLSHAPVARTKPAPAGGRSMNRGGQPQLNERGTRLYDLNKILELWCGGHQIEEIAAVLGPRAKPATVGAMVSTARQRGDARAWHAGDPRRRANRVGRLTDPAPAAPSPPADRGPVGCQFAAGDRVSHPIYGGGVVAEVGAYNARRRDWPLWIKFDSSRDQVLYSWVVASAMGMRRRAA